MKAPPNMTTLENLLSTDILEPYNINITPSEDNDTKKNTMTNSTTV
jgi:hypothetical protein